MSKPLLEVVTVEYEREWDYYERVKFFLDGEYVGSGRFGGEPEDNTRYRDYAWVDDIIKTIATRLGAEVVFTDVIENEDE
jgi:hypothetical protein